MLLFDDEFASLYHNHRRSWPEECDSQTCQIGRKCCIAGHYHRVRKPLTGAAKRLRENGPSRAPAKPSRAKLCSKILGAYCDGEHCHHSNQTISNGLSIRAYQVLADLELQPEEKYPDEINVETRTPQGREDTSSSEFGDLVVSDDEDENMPVTPPRDMARSVTLAPRRRMVREEEDSSESSHSSDGVNVPDIVDEAEVKSPLMESRLILYHLPRAASSPHYIRKFFAKFIPFTTRATTARIYKELYGRCFKMAMLEERRFLWQGDERDDPVWTEKQYEQHLNLLEGVYNAVQDHLVFVEIANRVSHHKELFSRRAFSGTRRSGDLRINDSLLPKIKQLIECDPEYNAAYALAPEELQNTAHYIVNIMVLRALMDELQSTNVGDPHFRSAALSSGPGKSELSSK